MERLLELRRERADAVKGVQEMLSKAEEEKRELTEEEETQYSEAKTKIEKLRKAEDRESEVSGWAEGTRDKAILPDPKEAVEDSEYKNLGEFMLDVRAATLAGGKTSPKWEKRAILGLNETVPAEGGFLVDKPLSSELIKRVYDTGTLASRCRRIQIGPGANGLKINAVDETSRVTGSRWGGVQTYWAGEATGVTASKPAFRQMSLELKKLMSIYYATDEELADATALTSVATQAFTEDMGFMLDDAIIRGSGAGQPQGILSGTALITVAKETGQAADTILFENISKMWNRMRSKNRANAVWFINQEIEPELDKMAFPVGTAAVPVYLPMNGISGAGFSTLKGKPVIPIEQASGAGDVGDIMLLDLSQYLLIEKGGIQAASSIHVQFLTDQQVFRFTMRVDGQPIWNSALTPYKKTASGYTIGPYVTLAAR